MPNPFSVPYGVSYFLQNTSMDFLLVTLGEFNNVTTIADRVNFELEILWGNTESPRTFAGCKIHGFPMLLRQEPLASHVRDKKEPIPLSQILECAFASIRRRLGNEGSDLLIAQEQIFNLVSANTRNMLVPYEVWKQAL